MTMLPGLLEWYGPRRSAYPWRSSNPDPYAVLVSEVMLQQTQAPRVVPAFERFIRRFHTVQDLAAAPMADVIREWSGLGYNRRAAWLSAAARAIVAGHDGVVPADTGTLESLPGVGPYTAAAVASLAYGKDVPAVDTNVRRILCRAFLGIEPGGAGEPRIRIAAEAAIDRSDPGAWNQALMDLGREVCRPVPRCEACPISKGCRSAGRVEAPSPSRRRQAPFEGSMRQVRGAVVRELAAGGGLTLRALARRTTYPIGRLGSALSALCAEGLVEAGPAALKGRPSARVRLRESEGPTQPPPGRR
jgi:A/G-specific adenine glycosylase